MKLTLVFGKRNNLCPHTRCPFGLPMCQAFSPDAYTIGTSNGQVLGSSLAMSFRYVGLPENLILKSTC